MERGGDQQRLHHNRLVFQRQFQFLIKDALVCRVHVNDNQTLFILRQDIGTE